MNWDQLRFFLAVAKLGSLNAAARALQVSQPTVWRRIYDLEQALQTSLFDTNRSGYTVTPAGLKLIPLAEQMATVATEIKVAVQEGSGLSGTVRLSAPEILSTQLASEVIYPLSKKHPSLVVKLFTASPLTTTSDTDIAILWNKSIQGNYSCLAEYSVPFALYGTESYLENHVGIEKDTKLEDHLLIDFDDNGEHLAPSSWYKKSTAMTRVFRSNSPQARLTAAINNMGLALLPCCFVKNESSLVKVKNEDEIGSLNVYLYLNNQREHLPHVVELSQYLKGKLRRLLVHEQ